MAGDNKILTVSFGTFSCTLEGFEDPLEAMRDITEYFRDLSSEDRYFGAEPLSPDPERLQLMARQGTASRVERGVSASGSVALSRAEVADADEVTEDGALKEEPEDAGSAGTHDVRGPEEMPTARPVAPETPEAPRTGPAAEADHVDHPEADEEAGAARYDLTHRHPFEKPSAVTARPQPEEASHPAAPEDVPDSVADRLAKIRAAAGTEMETGTEIEEDSDEEPTEPTAISRPLPDTEPPEEIAPAPEATDEVEMPEVSEQPASPERGAQPGATDQPAAMRPAGERGASVFEGAPIDTGNGTADRIFRDADTALEDIEARRRHSAIAHLKAAVSATVNDRNILGWRKKQNDEEEDAYRADLAEAVIPDRSVQKAAPRQAETAATPRPVPEGDQGAPVIEPDAGDEDLDGYEEPLVLGLDARVDPNSLAALALTEDDRVESQTYPVRPRTSDESFAEFAARNGARDLIDLLEAAAAYSGQIEGRPQFSRPQIMKHVVAVTTQDYTREDGLRSFGALLRQGKIEKLKRGLFVLSDTSRFAAAQRLAGE